jgi:hypothetical protein
MGHLLMYIYGKSPSHVPHLPPKSDFDPSSVKPGIWDPSAIKSVYFWSLGSFEGDFRMNWPQPDIWDSSTIKSIYFRSLGCFRGWFLHNVMMSPTCEVHVICVPRVMWLPFSLSSCSTTRARRVVLLCMLHHRSPPQFRSSFSTARARRCWTTTLELHRFG